MKLLGFLILNFLLSSNLGWAACKEHVEANFTAEFEIVKIETPHIECIFDEQGNVLKNQPVKVEKEGCILRMNLVKLKKGKPPQGDNSVNLYSIYENGPLCKKKVGSHLTKELEYSGAECCAEREVARESGSQDYCKMTPKAKPIVELTEKYVRCSQRGVNWKFAK